MVKESSNYPGVCRIAALKELQKLIKNNNNTYKHGMLSQAMANCPIIKDSNRYYLLSRWIKPFLLKNNMQLNAIDFKFLKKIMQEISITFKLGTSNEKTRMYHTNPQRLCPINKYIYPILKGYLEEQDHKGFILSARSKLAR